MSRVAIKAGGGKFVVSEAPVVDIALATYNGAAHLGEQLASIEHQRGVRWRLHVLDDGSTDGTLAILSGFQERHVDRVRIMKPVGGRLGPARAFGRVLLETTAPYVCLCDQDDVWLRDKLATMVHLLDQGVRATGGGPVLVHSDLEVVDEALRPVAASLDRFQNLGARSRTELRHLLVQNSVTGCTICMNRALVDLVAPIPEEAVMHDWWIALVAAAFGKVVYHPAALVRYRQHGANVMGARRWGLPPRGSSMGSLRASIDRTYVQAEGLLSRFGAGLPAAAGRTIEAYVALQDLGPIRRRVHLIRQGFFKHGPLKTLGMLWAM